MKESDDYSDVTWDELLLDNMLSDSQTINLCQSNIYRDVPRIVATALGYEDFKRNKIFIGCECVGQMEQLAQLLKQYIAHKLGFRPRVSFFGAEDVGFNASQQIAGDDNHIEFTSVEQLYQYCNNYGLSPFSFSASQVGLSQIILFLQPLLTDPRQACLNEFVHPSDIIVLCGSNLYLPDRLSAHLSQKQLEDVSNLLEHIYKFFAHSETFQDIFLNYENIKGRNVNPGVASHVRQTSYGRNEGLIGDSLMQNEQPIGYEQDIPQNHIQQPPEEIKMGLKDFLMQLILLVSALLDELKHLQTSKRENIQKRLKNLTEHKNKLLEDKKAYEVRCGLSEHANSDDKKRLTEINAQINRVGAQILDLEAEAEVPAIKSVKSPQALATRLWLKENVSLEFLQGSSRYLSAFFDLLDTSGFIDVEILNALKDSDESALIGQLYIDCPELGQNSSKLSRKSIETSQDSQVFIQERLQQLKNNLYEHHLKKFLQTLEDIVSISQFADMLSTFFDPNWRFVSRNWREAQRFYVPAVTAGRVIALDLEAAAQTGLRTGTPNQLFSPISSVLQLQLLDPLIELKEISFYANKLLIFVPFCGDAKLKEVKTFFSRIPGKTFRAFSICERDGIQSSFKDINDKKAISGGLYVPFDVKKARNSLIFIQNAGPPLQLKGIKLVKQEAIKAQNREEEVDNSCKQSINETEAFYKPCNYKYLSESIKLSSSLNSTSFQGVRHYIVTTGADQSALSLETPLRPETAGNYAKLFQQLCAAAPDGTVILFPTRKALGEFIRLSDAAKQLHNLTANKLFLVSTPQNDYSVIWNGMRSGGESGRGVVFMGVVGEWFVNGVVLGGHRCRLLVFAGFPAAVGTLAEGEIINQHRGGVEVKEVINEIVEWQVRRILQSLIPAPRAAVVYADFRFQQLFAEQIERNNIVLGAAGTEREIAAFVSGA